MATTVKEMLAAANAAVPKVQPAEVEAMRKKGDVLVVDVRDIAEVKDSGKLKGAVNVSRGMLEFRADPESPYHNAEFQKDKTVLVYCASGGRSALRSQTEEVESMGDKTVYTLGGFKDLKEAGPPTEPG